MTEYEGFRFMAEGRYRSLSPLKWKEMKDGRLIYREELKYSDFAMDFPERFEVPDEGGFEVKGEGDFEAAPLLSKVHDDWVARQLQRLSDDKVELLSLAGWKHGYFIDVKNGESAALNVSLVDGLPFRLVFRVGKGASLGATVITPSGTQREKTVKLVASRIDVVCEPGSTLDLAYKAGSSSVEFIGFSADLGASSSLKLDALHVAGSYGRHFGEVVVGEGASLSARVAELIPRSSFGDSMFNVRHASQSESEVDMRAAVLGKGVIRGLTSIPKGAVGSNANLQERVIMIGKEAKAITSPSLDIYEKEVQARHGSWSGRIGDRELFYLESRGLSEKEAVSLLIRGFLSPFERIVPLEEILEGIVLGRELRARTAGKARFSNSLEA
ncbi:MAG: SufB/SufD family protein [Thermoprotei archaeon]